MSDPSEKTAGGKDLALDMLAGLCRTSNDNCQIMSCLASQCGEEDMAKRLFKAARVFKEMERDMRAKQTQAPLSQAEGPRQTALDTSRRS